MLVHGHTISTNRKQSYVIRTRTSNNGYVRVIHLLFLLSVRMPFRCYAIFKWLVVILLALRYVVMIFSDTSIFDSIYGTCSASIEKKWFKLRKQEVGENTWIASHDNVCNTTSHQDKTIANVESNCWRKNTCFEWKQTFINETIE